MMNRRGFFKMLMAGVAAITVAPKMIFEKIRTIPRRIKAVGKVRNLRDFKRTPEKIVAYYKKRKVYNKDLDLKEIRRYI